jgi:2,3-bisphosphoglycerate-independent phosphoglycerate mutase
VFCGWKNFFVNDHPTPAPRQTMARKPVPVLISCE